MKELKIISLGEAMERLRDGLPVEGTVKDQWYPVYRQNSGMGWTAGGYTHFEINNIFAWSFRIPAEPEIVKPVVQYFHAPVASRLIGFDVGYHLKEDTHYAATIRLQSQQERLDALVEAFLAYDHDAQEHLRKFLRAEKEAK